MEMNLTVPAAYILFFFLLFIAGLLGCFMRSCCVWLEKDEKKITETSLNPKSSSNIMIVVDPHKPVQSQQNGSIKIPGVGLSLCEPVPVHLGVSRNSAPISSKYTTSDQGLESMIVPALQRRSKIRRTGIYDELHMNKLSHTI